MRSTHANRLFWNSSFDSVRYWRRSVIRVAPLA